MLFIPLLLIPVVMIVVALVERRLGPSAAGWVAALPIAFTLAVVTVGLDGGPDRAAGMALSAASHVPAQVAFGIVAARILHRRGLVVAAVTGAAVYAACSLVIATVPVELALAAAVLALVLGPRAMPFGTPAPSRQGSPAATALASAAALAIVVGAVLASRLATPQVAGAIAAFPTISLTVVAAVVTREGRTAGAQALAGLVRSLPCYLTFCLAVALTLPVGGLLVAVPAGLAVGLALAFVTWRGVPVAVRPAPASTLRPDEGPGAGSARVAIPTVSGAMS